MMMLPLSSTAASVLVEPLSVVFEPLLSAGVLVELSDAQPASTSALAASIAAMAVSLVFNVFSF
jgi:hypothetical protein